MDIWLFALVLFAAVLHASWNAMVKSADEPLLRLTLITLVGALCALPLLVVATPPAPAAWPYVLGSVAVHLAYYAALLASYRFGDLSQVYPIARGAAPLLVAVGAFAFAGEWPGAGGLVAAALICTSVLLLAGRGSARATLCALACGACIAAYTVIDGLGVRAAGDALGYIAWLFVLDPLPLLLHARRWHGPALWRRLGTSWRGGLIGGACAFAAYALVVFALSRAPMALVAALRETSVLLATLIGTRLLAEPLGARRLLAAAGVVAGVALLNWAR